MVAAKVFNLDDIEEDIEEFEEEFSLRDQKGRETGDKVKILFRTPSADKGKSFAAKRQGEITDRGRIKKLPNDLEVAISALKACIPAVNQWPEKRIWTLIRRTGGLVNKSGVVQFCYDLLGLERDDDGEIIISEGPTDEDYPSSSSPTSEDASAQ